MSRESLYVARSHVGAQRTARTWSPTRPSTSTCRLTRAALDALEVLRDVLARESSGHCATETIGETLEAAESLATLPGRQCRTGDARGPGELRELVGVTVTLHNSEI